MTEDIEHVFALCQFAHALPIFPLIQEEPGLLTVHRIDPEAHVTLTDDDLIVYNQYAGDGYGVMSDAKLEAVKLMAQTEGIMIDPVYTATSMACLIDLARKGDFRKTDNVVFLHTGGAVALFPYKEPLRSYLEGKPLPWKTPEWNPR